MRSRAPISDVARGISVHESLQYCLHRLIDAGVIVGTVELALDFTPQAHWAQTLAIAASTILVFHVVAELSGLYRSWRGSRLRREIGCIIVTWAYTVPALLGIGLIAQFNAHYTYVSKLLWICVTPALMVAARIVLRKVQQHLRSRGFNTRRCAVVGVNDLGLQLARNLASAPEIGLRLDGFYDDRPLSRTATLPDELGARRGGLDELVDRARRGDVQIVYITFPMRAEDRIRGVLARLADTTASVYIVPDFFVFELLHARWTSINGLPAVSVFENPLYGVDGLLKRVADVVFGTLLLALFSVPMLAIAAAVKLSSPGPVFFRQKRYGLDGREILVWKFRSMSCCEDGANLQQATRNDRRVTRVGALLRRTSLDELPQLFNVIGGSMSLVGPRPHARAHNEEFRSLIDGYMLRHKVKPGMTGLAQVNGYRGETETLEKMERRVECDHQYIKEWSLWMDLRILAKTAFVVLLQRNAY